MDDTRGILDPAAMLRHVEFARHDAGEDLAGLVAWFWTVTWDLPDGQTHQQRVLNHPAGHISIGTVDDRGVPLDPAVGRAYPILTGVSDRLLTGRGWTVAARTTVGGMGVFVDGPVKGVADSELRLPGGLPGLDASVVDDVISVVPDLAAGVDRLREALTRLVAARAGEMLTEARFVARVADRAEEDRSISRIEELAAEAGVSVRSLQRLFDHHVGVSPSTVIRRWRLIEAADAAAAAGGDNWEGWTAVAARLGYSDQAHLSRDFSRHLGLTPSAYVAEISGP